MANVVIPLPQISDDQLDEKQERRKIKAYLYMLAEQLRYQMSNIDANNIASGGLDDLIKGVVNTVVSNSVISKDEYDALGKRVKTNESAISQNATQILQRVTQKVYEELAARVDATEAGLEGAATSAELTDVISRVTTAESTIEQYADLIESKVSQTIYDTLAARVDDAETALADTATAEDVTALTTRVTTAESSIQQQAGRIDLKVSSETYETGMAGKLGANDAAKAVQTQSSHVRITDDEVRVITAATRFQTDDFVITDADGARELFSVDSGEVAIGADILTAPKVRGDVINTGVGGVISWKGGIQATIDSIPKHLLNNATINVPAGTYTEYVVISGIKGALLTLSLESGVTIHGSVSVICCDSVRFVASAATTAYIIGTQKGLYTTSVYIYRSAVTLENITISGCTDRTSAETGVGMGIVASFSYLIVRGCGIERVRDAIVYSDGSTGYVFNCIGGIVNGADPTTVANLNKSIYAQLGSHVGLIGTIPTAAGGTGADGGTLVGTGVPTGSTGTAPAITAQTVVITNTASGRLQSRVDTAPYMSWESGVNPWQGKYSDIRYRCYGLWCFSNLASTIAAAANADAITSAKLSVKRTGAYGATGATIVKLYANEYDAVPTGFTAPTHTYFAEASIERGATQVFDVTALVKALKAGTRAALGFSLDKDGNVAQMEMTATLEITMNV